MRLQAAVAEELGHAAVRVAHGLGEKTSGPTAAPDRRRRHRKLDDSLTRRRRDLVVFAARSLALGQATNSVIDKAPSDSGDSLRREIEPGGNLGPAQAISSEQDYAGAAHESGGCRRLGNDRLQLASRFSTQLDHHRSAHVA